MKAKELITKVLVVNPKITVSLFAVMLLISGLHGVSYGATPEFSSATAERSIEENTAVGVSIGLPVLATDTGNHRLTYSIGAAGDAAFFEIGETTGRLRTLKVLNYEIPEDTSNPAGDNAYVVTVTATDPDNNIAEITVTITVTDVNEAPMFDNEGTDPTVFQIRVREVDENTPAGQNIGTSSERVADPVEATDPDADPTLTTDPDSVTDTNPGTNVDDDLIYTLTGPDALLFDIDEEGQLKTKTVLDYEDPQDRGGTAGDNVYTVVVIVSDSESGGLSARVPVTITVMDADEAPEFLLGPGNTPATRVGREVAENAMAGTKIGAPVTATDPDAGDTLTYRVSDTNFVIESDGQLKTLVSLDHEDQPSYVVTVTATDDDDTVTDNVALSNIIAVTITVGDENDAPTFPDPDTEDGMRSIAENRTGTVGTPVRATDPDGDTLTYTVIDILGRNDAKSFTIDNNGQLRTRAGLDYEDQSSYTVRVTVSDRKNPADTRDTEIDDEITVTIGVTDVNEAPAFPYDTALNRLYVYEGEIGQDVIDPEGELNVIDPDVGAPNDLDEEDDTNPGNNGNDDLSYVLSGPDAGKFSYTNGQLETSEALVYATAKRAYTLTVIVRDSATGGLSDIITVTIRLVESTASTPKVRS